MHQTITRVPSETNCHFSIPWFHLTNITCLTLYLNLYHGSIAMLIFVMRQVIYVRFHPLSGPTTSLYYPSGSHLIYNVTWQVDKDEIYWRRRKKKEELEWSQNSTLLISQLAQCFTNTMDGWIGGLFNRTNTRRRSSFEKFVDYPLSPLEKERLQMLQERLQVPYDDTRPDHREALTALWHCSFPNVSLSGLISDQWKDMGWQGPNPSTDFRGCGFISLENLLFFARTYPASFHRLMLKKDGHRATYEYPFSVAGINISFMLIQMLDLYSGKPRCIAGMNFVKLLGENEEAFNILYCIAFKMMDEQWLAMNASYMNFNEVLHATRMKLERELSLKDINTIEYMFAYNILYK